MVSCGSGDGAWHAADVSVNCTASDGGSGLANAADGSFSLQTSVADGTEDANASTGSRTITDGVGNMAPAGPVAGHKVDKKAPTLACGSADGAWHPDDVSIACTASDFGAGLANAADARRRPPSHRPAWEPSCRSCGRSRDRRRHVTHGVGHAAAAGGRVVASSVSAATLVSRLKLPSAAFARPEPTSVAVQAGNIGRMPGAVGAAGGRHGSSGPP